jgi:hypothetical protein
MGVIVRPGDTIWAVLLLALSLVVLLAALILLRRKKVGAAIRTLPVFQKLGREVGYAAERGGTIHLALGSGGLNGGDVIMSLAGLEVLEALADDIVSYHLPVIVTVGDPTLLPIAQDVLRRAYERKDLSDLYDPTQVRFIAPTPLAYAGGAAQVVSAEGVTTNVMAGSFGAEVSLIANAATGSGLSQFAAVADPQAIGALYPTTDQLAIGEELYAAGAQMTQEKRYVVSLLVEDVLRILLVLSILLVSVLAFVRGGI